MAINVTSFLQKSGRGPQEMGKQVFDSAYQRRIDIAKSIQSGIIDSSILDLLIADGIGLSDEGVLWDFKRELPPPPHSKSNDFMRDQHEMKMAEIVKDAVSFYNSHGGYLIAGLDDVSREILGFDQQFDAADLNKKIQGATGHSVETIFRQLEYNSGQRTLKVGLLFVPKRPLGIQPAQFNKNAPMRPNGKRSYQLHDFYFRDRDNCQVARTAGDFEFLYGPREILWTVPVVATIENNLPPRDNDLGRLIGRDAQLAALWSWLSDAFSPIKILCGLGGVGKTSIAYTFVERLIDNSPHHIDRIVWLGAKTHTFSPTAGTSIPMPRVDFATIDDLLIQILLETGLPPSQLPENISRDDALHLVQQHLSEFSYFLVVDNVDTMPDEEQQLVLHLLTQLCSLSKTKAVVTARRNLGTSRSVYIEIGGLTFDDFRTFVEEKCELLGIKTPEMSLQLLLDFHTASGGSPLFAMSILRLLTLGDNLRDAIRHWKGSDGEKVRDAAFQREIGRLSAEECRVLLALCYLPQASLLEISVILGLNRYQVQNALERLQSFSMTSLSSALPGGATFTLPPTMSLIAPLVERRVPDASAIARECKKHRDLVANQTPFVSDAITRTISRLKAGDDVGALEVVNAALNHLPENGDLLCLKGRVYLDAGEYGQAEECFEKARELGCRKRELIDGWISARRAREDWRGLMELADIGERELRACRYRLVRCEAIMAMGDQQSRIGNDADAEQHYLQGLEHVREGLNLYSFPGDRALLWRINEGLAIRWLGSVRMLSSNQSDAGRRFFGACHKVVVTFRCVTESIIFSGLRGLEDWLHRLSVRRGLSPTAVENLDIAQRRLLQIGQIIQDRSDFSCTPRRKFEAEATRLNSGIDSLKQRITPDNTQ